MESFSGINSLNNLPEYALTALAALELNGFYANIVGGCVRDLFLNKMPYDYDITTNALPEQICEVFKGYHCIKTGIKHGTVTVVINKTPVEITTYRIDGKYTDSRHPDSVTFTDRLDEDLARRDFTINAMAYNPSRGVTDIFGGQTDLEKRLIRCVGDADTRFNEDALRILRALRFAAVLEFDIEKSTAMSIHANKQLLKNIAAERIRAEFFKLICGNSAAKILDEYKDVFAVFIPQLMPMFGFEQHSKYHCYDVWRHSLCALEHTEPLPILRLGALFHDIGKPDVFTLDENGCGHFYSHAVRSVSLTRDILASLKCDNATARSVLTIIENHDICIADSKKSIKKWLGRLGEKRFFMLIALQKADAAAHCAPYCTARPPQLEHIRQTAEKIIREGECFSLCDLAVNGRDMIALGFSGKQIGCVLDMLLNSVINGETENEKHSLTEKAEKFKNNINIQ